MESEDEDESSIIFEKTIKDQSKIFLEKVINKPEGIIAM